jgi:hypothetical protein
MKKLFCIVYIALSFTFLSCSNDIFDNIKEHASEEKVYVGTFDKAEAFVGINRLEIDLLNAGRIPASQVNIGKASQTIVEYDNKTYTYEVQSWLNITGLTEPRLYRIKVYNIDELGNKSIPIEAAAIPFTAIDIAALTVPIPQKLQAPTSVQFNWANGLTSSFFDFYEMEYSYTDDRGIKRTEKSTDNNSLLILNLTEGSADSVKMRLKVVPKQNNIPILDTLYLETTMGYQLPTIAEYLNARTARKIKDPFIAGSKATVTWGDATDHLVVCELMYETTSGDFNTVVIPAGETTVECPNAKRDVLYKIRSGFMAPGSIDTLYKEWTTSKYPFLTLMTGTYIVDPSSYRGPNNTYSAEFAEVDDIVTITAVEEGLYSISDFLGSYYYPGGRTILMGGYSSGHTCPGTFSFDNSEFVLIDHTMDSWGTGVDGIEGSWNATTRTLTLDVYWGDYIFHLILKRE